MALNFKMAIHRNSNNVHLKLFGDFDGASACELINALERNCKGGDQIFIHTACLRNIAIFGASLFQKNLGPIRRKHIKLVFTGDNAAKLTY